MLSFDKNESEKRTIEQCISYTIALVTPAKTMNIDLKFTYIFSTNEPHQIFVWVIYC